MDRREDVRGIGRNVMFSRVMKRMCFAASLLILAGCDMEDLVKTKVPEPLRHLLSSGAPPPAVKGPGGIPQPPRVGILVPGNKSVYPVGKEVVFRGNAEIPGQPGAKLDLTWTLFKDKAQQGTPLGKALSVKKVLEAGNYRVEFVLQHQDKRVVRSAQFRVVYNVPGKVLTSDGKGLAQTEMILSDLGQEKVVTRATSGRDGSFSVELPPTGHFILTPQKKGFSFNPYHWIAQYRKDAPAIEFKAVKAEIKDIRLTASVDSDEDLTTICPNQEAWIKFEMQSEDKPQSMEVFLASIVDNKTKLTELDQVKDDSNSGPDQGISGKKALRIKVPAGLRTDATEVLYHVVLTVRNEKGGVFSVEGPDTVKANLLRCFAKFLEEGVALQQKGELEAATKTYGLMETIDKKLLDKRPFMPYMEKTHFNKALADIGIAVALPDHDTKRSEHLTKALSGFNSVLKVRKRDVEALLLRGITKQLVGDDESSVEDFSQVLSVEPASATALEHRARGLIKSKIKKNLSKAVDDLTEAIALDPAAKDLRTIRSQALRVLIKAKDEPEDSIVDTSTVKLGEADKGLALDNFIRK